MTRSFSFLPWFGLVILASLALYHVSDHTQKLSSELRQINAAIDSERQNLHVIKANYVYLASPERLEKSVKKFLPLRPSQPQQVAGLNHIPTLFPTHGEALATLAYNDLPRTKAQGSAKNNSPTPPKGATAKGKVKLASTDTKYKSTTQVAMAQKPSAASRVMAATTMQPQRLGTTSAVQHTASAAPLPDSIGSLITELGSHP